MSEFPETLQRKLKSAGELKSVVRTMKALAASSIVQYERAVESLADYHRAVEFGLVACVKQSDPAVQTMQKPPRGAAVAAIVFGSDQGLVGQFNEHIARFAAEKLASRSSAKIVWAVGDRLRPRLEDAGLSVKGVYVVPNSVAAITPLVSRILIDNEVLRQKGKIWEVHVFHNQPGAGATYESVRQRLFPFDEEWQRDLGRIKWPTKLPPQVLDRSASTFLALIREYLVVSLFKACAESLASENASRLASMQRAERNIDERVDELRTAFNQNRQSSIDEELFDVISGFEALRPHSR
jgi:F-type H+-transporting ATPase subunit gamma